MFAKLFGSVSDRKSTSKDIEAFKEVTSTKPTTTSTTTVSSPSVDTTTTTTTTSTTSTKSTTTTTSTPKQLKDFTLEQLFDKYLQISKEEDVTSDTVTVSGLLAFCEDLGINPQDIAMLIILYKLKSATQYVVTKEQFVNGWTSLNCRNLTEMKAYLPRARQEFNEPQSELFKQVYLFAFDYNKEPDQKSFANSDAIDTWKLFYTDRWPHVDKWSEFIEKYGKTISRDTWTQFYAFVKEHGADLSNYNADDGSWPVLIDDFVEFIRSQ